MVFMLNLPHDLLLEIFSYLDTRDIVCTLAVACKKTRQFLTQPALYRRVQLIDGRPERHDSMSRDMEADDDAIGSCKLDGFTGFMLGKSMAFNSEATPLAIAEVTAATVVANGFFDGADSIDRRDEDKTGKELPVAGDEVLLKGILWAPRISHARYCKILVSNKSQLSYSEVDTLSNLLCDAIKLTALTLKLPNVNTFPLSVLPSTLSHLHISAFIVGSMEEFFRPLADPAVLPNLACFRFDYYSGPILNLLMARAPSLSALTLSWLKNHQTEDLCGFLAAASNLRHLSVQVYRDGLDTIITTLVGPELINLTSLTLYVRLSDAVIDDILRGLTLRKVRLPQNSADDNGSIGEASGEEIWVPTYLATSLRALCLHVNQEQPLFGPEAIAHLRRFQRLALLRINWPSEQQRLAAAAFETELKMALPRCKVCFEVGDMALTKTSPSACEIEIPRAF